MFKKMTALFLLTAFTQVYAVTPLAQATLIKQELNKTLDELNFKLNVEWDQKDTKMFDQTVAEFEKDIAKLQKEGLTSEDLVKNSIDKIKDQQVQDEVKELQKVIADGKMTQVEARNFVLAKLSSTYAHGASWSGSRHGMRCGWIIGAIIIILIVCHERNNNDDNCEPTDDRTYCEIYPYDQQCYVTYESAI
jgi:hypothetical protein